MPLNDEATANERTSVLSEAFDKLDAEPASPDTVTAEPAVETKTPAPDTAPSPASSSGPARDPETGRFSPKEETATKAEPVKAETATKAPEPAVKTETPPPEPAVQTESIKAPQSFKPIAREDWAKTPPSVQAEILRREKEMSTRLQADSEPVKAWKAFEQVVQPYESMIRDAGATHPLQVVGNLLQTARVLRYGTPGEKAQMAARIVRDFGVGIEELDSALSGGAAVPTQAPQQIDPAAIAAQVEANLQKRLQAQAQQMAQQRQAQEFEEFTKTHEFATDVKNDMEFLIATARQRGMAMSLNDAYNRAVALDPEISKVIEQRKAAEAAKAQAASMQKTKAAASSIRSQPTAAVEAQSDDRREVLSRTYDKLVSR
jgi:hypothetical protein